MSILINKNTKLIVQGATGRDGSFHALRMKRYGTKVVGGSSPGKGGSKLEDIPIFNTVQEAVEQTGANTSVIFVPAPFAKDAIMEAADGGIKLIIAITEGISTLDVVEAHAYSEKKGALLIGPNCPGIISPNECVVGIMPTQIFKKGRVGLISRSGTLTYELAYNLSAQGMGISTAVGIGGDPVVGLHYRQLLDMFEQDPETDAIVLVGEIGGDAEEQTAAYIKQHIKKPVAAFIAGQTAPPGKQMGHAGAIVSGSAGTAAEKIAALTAVGIPVAKEPAEISKLVAKLL